MNMLNPIPTLSRGIIEQFLQTLSQLSPEYGHIYLAGEAALVRLGLRPGREMKIELVVDAADEEKMRQALQRCIDLMHVHVELSSPEDYIPVPWNWDTRVKHIGTYGQLEVFYYDLPSIALGKIALNTQEHIYDVQLMLQQQVVSLHELDDMYLQVQPRMGKPPYKHIDPQEFANHYSQVRRWLAHHAQSSNTESHWQ